MRILLSLHPRSSVKDNPSQSSGISVVDRELESNEVLCFSGGPASVHETTVVAVRGGDATVGTEPTGSGAVRWMWLIETASRAEAEYWATFAASVCAEPVHVRELAPAFIFNDRPQMPIRLLGV